MATHCTKVEVSSCLTVVLHYLCLHDLMHWNVGRVKYRHVSCMIGVPYRFTVGQYDETDDSCSKVFVIIMLV